MNKKVLWSILKVFLILVLCHSVCTKFYVLLQGFFLLLMLCIWKIDKEKGMYTMKETKWNNLTNQRNFDEKYDA